MLESSELIELKPLGGSNSIFVAAWKKTADLPSQGGSSRPEWTSEYDIRGQWDRTSSITFYVSRIDWTMRLELITNNH